MMMHPALHRFLGYALVSIGLGACGDTPATPPSAVAPSASAVRIAPSPLRIAVGADSQAIAIVTDDRGTILSNQDVRWSSTNVSVAFVTDGGLVQGRAAGTAIITAIVGNHIGLDTVTVVGPTS
ncbi:MAG TPA: Ig-like domain-containing protein [Gemmatimonadaceae bacterium]|nr:Ig-like domain-containing protein [Gemmatimonadaceae bacterium]